MTGIGLEMILAGALQITVRSVSWQTPSQEVPWELPGAAVRLELTNSVGQVYFGTAQQQSDASITVGNVTDLPADTYLVRVYTPGYVLTRDYTVQVSLGGLTGITVDLLETTPMQITLVFITAGLIAPVDAYPYSLTQVPVGPRFTTSPEYWRVQMLPTFHLANLIPQLKLSAFRVMPEILL